MAQVKRALISVSDKTGIVDFAKGLAELGVEILSTGGTARKLREAGLTVKDVSEYTGFPEMMDGRVKTLHPKVHAALLALRDNPEHMRQLEEQNVELIDMVVVNLYPFQATIAKPDVTLEDAIENIDIGGPTMLRSSAKNFKHVAVVTDPGDYDNILRELKATGEVSAETKSMLAVKVFRHTADYDAAIDTYLSRNLADEQILRLKFVHGTPLRYGENWHQKAKFYRQEGVSESCISQIQQLHGKELSFNNYLDGDGSFEAVKSFKDRIAVSVIKHTNPCGLATGETLEEAMEAAWAGDPVSAFGSVISTTRTVDLKTAEFLKGKFVEAIIAPGFEDDALDYLKNKSKDIRLLQVPDLFSGAPVDKTYRYVTGGMLEQSRDLEMFEKWESVTEHTFPDDKKALAEFTWKAAKHTKSNAIMIGYEYKPGQFQVMGMGAGQPNRVDALRKLAVTKAEENFGLMYDALDMKPPESREEFIKSKMGECVLASDAFFPFDDNIKNAHAHNIKYIVEPGGSNRDDEVINTANELGVALVFTGMRHFMH
ncbi:bifunctional phosphoribosylaminoimidazolecarboxamide formyltransferase/IMP cyclohydrolase [[Eubacterium] cellulosolvens]